MAKFMYKASYSKEGLQGTVDEGFAKREAYLRELMSSMGISLEAVYWSLGDEDIVVILDGPIENVVGGSIAATLSGVGKINTTALLTGAQMDEAVAKMPNYRSPGQ